MSDADADTPRLAPHHYETRAPHPDDPREYGPVRSYVRGHPERFAAVDSWLAAAGADERVEEYLPRSARYGVAGAVAGAVLGLLIASLLGLSGSLAVGPSLLLAPTLAVGGALVGGVAVGGGHALMPRVWAYRRARRTRVGLPHATVFLYALSHGGVNAYESMRRLADAEGTYGPVAGEFGKVVADTEWFDRDLFTALAAARDRTPSGECAVFLDEFVSVLRTGGDVGEFLQGEARDNLDAAQERQAELLDDLDTLAEVYVVFVFAGPVFLLVVLLVVSFVQPDVLGVMRALVYLLIPVAILGFLGVFFWLMEPYRAHTESPGGAGAGHGRDSFDGPPDDGRLDSYEADRESSTVERLRTETLATLRERPSRILSVTVPLGLLVAATTVFFTPAEEAVARTAGVLAVPFLLSAVPYGALYERKRRHQRAVRRRFPDALEVVGEAVDNRVPLGDAFGLVAQRAGGDLARELSRLHRDVTWTHDVRGALSRFADRAGVPQISRTVRLLEESVRATDDLGPILRLVSEDLDRRNTIRRERRHRMQPYVIIVVLGFVVYLAIVVMFDSFFLPVVAERAAAATDLRGSTLRIDPASLAAYRRLFFHSALVQAVGNGLLLGKLLDDRLRSGVGYAALLTAMALVTFLVLA